jgi:DNA-binding NarL/FixJ family response regulator
MNNKINIAIYTEHKLLLEGIHHLFEDITDFDVVFKTNEKQSLFTKLSENTIHVLVIHIYEFTSALSNLIIQINNQFPKIKILILSGSDNEETVLRSIKAGAKGFLAKDTDRNELIEAVYSLRNGYDYYSKSITHILVNKYVSKLKTENDQVIDINSLSSRETEILKLWGNSFSNKEIADKLFISVRTVESHKNHIMQKLNLKTTVDLVKFAIKNNIIDV